MTSVREEARMLVSAVVKEVSRGPLPTAAPLGFLSPSDPPSASDVDWELKEVTWAPHNVLVEQLCHFTTFWDSSSPGLLSSTTHMAATLNTVPYIEILRSLSGQIELFYITTHAGLQSLRYFCCLTLQSGVQTGLRDHLNNVIDKAYRCLVEGVWRCTMVNKQLQSAYQAMPEYFHDHVLTPVPNIFTIAEEPEEEAEDEDMDICVDDDPEDDLDDFGRSLKNPLEDPKSHYLRLIVGENEGKAWGERPRDQNTCSTATSHAPTAPRVLMGRETLDYPQGFRAFQKSSGEEGVEKERMLQDAQFSRACDAEVWSCFVPKSESSRDQNDAMNVQDMHVAGSACNSRPPAREAGKEMKSCPGEMPTLVKLQLSNVIRPSTQKMKTAHTHPSSLSATTSFLPYPPVPNAGEAALSTLPHEPRSSAFTAIRPRPEGETIMAPTSFATATSNTVAVSLGAPTDATGFHVLLADTPQSILPSAFSQSLPQPLSQSQFHPPQGALPGCKATKRARNEDIEGKIDDSGGYPFVSTAEVPSAGKAPKRARHRLEDHAVRMQQHFLSLVDVISRRTIEPSSAVASSDKVLTDGPSSGGAIGAARNIVSSHKAVRKPRLRSSQLRKRD